MRDGSVRSMQILTISKSIFVQAQLRRIRLLAIKSINLRVLIGRFAFLLKMAFICPLELSRQEPERSDLLG